MMFGGSAGATKTVVFLVSESITPSSHVTLTILKRFQLYDAPRDAIKKSGVKYVELMHSKDNSLCCGVSGMMNCNDMSKALRAFRLDEVKEKKVDVLVTTCPKCLSHFSCLKYEKEKEEEKEGEGEEGREKEEKLENPVGIEVKYKEEVDKREITRINGITEYIVLTRNQYEQFDSMAFIPLSVFLSVLEKSKRLL